MPKDKFLPLGEFASLAGMSVQAARKAIRAGSWRGNALESRSRQGRGGRGGVRFEVKISSLPAFLKDRLRVTRSVLETRALPPSGTVKTGEAQVYWWAHHLRAALQEEDGSAARAEAIAALTEIDLLDWRQPPRPIRLSRSTIYRQLAKLEGQGLAGIGRKRRVDVGKPKVFISRVWDRAVPFDDATKAKIADNLRQEIRGLRAQAVTRHLVLEIAKSWLKKETAARGFRPNHPEAMDGLCRVPMALYTAEAKYRAVYDLNKDRDRFDNNLPRVKRTIEGMRPMEILCADVHPIDVTLALPDGRVGHPRLIAYMDVATRRVWVDILLVDGVGGVRNTDGIRSLAALMQDESWGIPETFYCDNGAEYLYAGYLDDALQLNGVNTGSGDRDSRIVRAIPYNAAAKWIEGWFHRFEVDYLRHVQGWHGGKLGAPKRPAKGKLPAPYEGGFEAFCELVQGFVRTYNAIPQRHGELKGDTPNGRFSKQVARGWAATVMDADNLLTVFVKTERRTVRKHGISVDGRSWNCPELDSYFDREVTVKIPVLGIGFNQLWVGNLKGEQIGVAIPDEVRHPLDTRHAQHSAARKSTTTRGTRALQKAAGRVDVTARFQALAEEFGPPPGVNPPGGTVSVNVPGSPGELAMIPVARTRKNDRDDEHAANKRQLDAIAEMNRAIAEAKRASK